ncbi:hypothetical protein BH09PAT2_BH09PAT2_02540 [soil metagenome]
MKIIYFLLSDAVFFAMIPISAIILLSINEVFYKRKLYTYKARKLLIPILTIISLFLPFLMVVTIQSIYWYDPAVLQCFQLNIEQCRQRKDCSISALPMPDGGRFCEEASKP